jgi:hypothetical protein
MRRTRWTTSCDVIPDGLSTSSNPSTGGEGSSLRSVVFPPTGCTGILLLHVGEERLDAGSASDGVVFLELDLRRDTQLELPGNARPQKRSDAIETIEGRLFLGVAAEYADINARVTQIGTHLGAGNGDEADDARILCRFSEEGRYLDADRFGDAVRSTRVTQKRPPLK